MPAPWRSTLFPYTTLFRSVGACACALDEGYNVLIFPEGKHNHLKKEWHFLEAIQTGAFLPAKRTGRPIVPVARSEEHTSELQSRRELVCRLLLAKKNRNTA